MTFVPSHALRKGIKELTNMSAMTNMEMRLATVYSTPRLTSSHVINRLKYFSQIFFFEVYYGDIMCRFFFFWGGGSLLRWCIVWSIIFFSFFGSLLFWCIVWSTYHFVQLVTVDDNIWGRVPTSISLPDPNCTGLSFHKNQFFFNDIIHCWSHKEYHLVISTRPSISDRLSYNYLQLFVPYIRTLLSHISLPQSSASPSATISDPQLIISSRFISYI